MTDRWSMMIGLATAVRQPMPRTFARLSGTTGLHARFNSRASLHWPLLWRGFEAGRASELEEAVAVDVSLDVVFQPIQRCLDVGLIGESRRLACYAAQPVVALPVVGKKPVNVASGDAARGVDGSLRSSVGEPQQRYRAASAARASNVHLVSFERRRAVRTLAQNIDKHLVAPEHCLDIQQAKTRNRAGGPLDPVRIGDSCAEHLIPAANSEHMTAAAHMRLEVDIPSAFAQRCEIGNGSLGSRQDHERGVPGNGLARS